MSDTTTKNQLTDSGESQKHEHVAEGESASTSNLEPEMFGDIDKRLKLLLDRANKLENTLNELYGKDDDKKDLDDESGEEVDSEIIFDSDDIDLEDFDLESEESEDKLATTVMNTENINVDVKND